MKEIIALIRPGRARLTKQKLEEKGFVAYTEERVSGRGKQKGLQYSGANGQGGISFLPKRMVTIFINDQDVEQVVTLLNESNKTGEIGDGKIFIGPVEDVVRIRTDERHQAALA